MYREQKERYIMSGPNIDPIKFKKNAFTAWQNRINTPKGNPNFAIPLNFSARPGVGAVKYNDPQFAMAYNNYCQQCIANGNAIISPDDFASRFYGNAGPVANAAEGAVGVSALGDAITNLASSLKSLLGKGKTQQTTPKNLTDAQKTELQEMANNFAAEMQKENGEFSVTDLNQFLQAQIYAMNPNGDGASVNVDQFSQNLKLIDPELTDDMAKEFAAPLADSSGNISKETLSKLYNGAVDSNGKITGQSFVNSLIQVSTDQVAGSYEGGEAFNQGLNQALSQGYEISEKGGNIVYTKDGKTFEVNMQTGLPVLPEE